jgi:predicted nucleic acid-binding protein
MLLIDTNIFLEVMLAQAKRRACVEFLNAVKTGELKAAVTDFSLYSIMIILDGEFDVDDAVQYASAG